MKFLSTAVYAASYHALSSARVMLAEADGPIRRLRTKRKIAAVENKVYDEDRAYWTDAGFDYDAVIADMSMSMSTSGSLPATPNTPAPVSPAPTDAPAIANFTPAPIGAPTTPSPIDPAAVTPSPVRPDPVSVTPINPAPTTPAPKTSAPVTSAPVTPATVTLLPRTLSPTVADVPNTPAPITPSPATPAPVTPAPVTPAPVTPAPEFLDQLELTDLENDLDSASYEVCQGDCDDDDDCIGANTRCFQRGGDAPLLGVPGCTGEGTAGVDYCFNANGYLWEVVYSDNAGDAIVPYADKDHSLATTGMLACQGDCDDDDDCSGNLRCFDRYDSDNTQDDPVPGCASPYPGVEGISGMDYCYDPTGLLVYVYENGEMFANKDQGKKLGNCQGDCDDNDDCAEGLVCGQRMTGDPIPEDCTNPYAEIDTWYEVDFCCDPAKAGCNP